MSKMKQSEWMRGLLKCESDIQTTGIRYAYYTLQELERDWMWHYVRWDMKDQRFDEFVNGYTDCLQYYGEKL